MKTISAILLIALFLVPDISLGASKAKIETLRGLKGMSVIVEGLQPGIKQYGLTKHQIQTDVELKLRMAGIKVLNEKERLSTLGFPYLYVNLNTSQIQKMEIVAFSVSVELQQFVELIRNNRTLSSNTWSAISVGSTGTLNLSFIRNHIKDKVDIFINDWLSVNPKK